MWLCLTTFFVFIVVVMVIKGNIVHLGKWLKITSQSNTNRGTRRRWDLVNTRTDIRRKWSCFYSRVEENHPTLLDKGLTLHSVICLLELYLNWVPKANNIFSMQMRGGSISQCWFMNSDCSKQMTGKIEMLPLFQDTSRWRCLIWR